MGKELLEIGSMELSAVLESYHLDVRPTELLVAMENSQIHIFGWPVAVVMHTEKYSPKPKNDGIEAEIDTDSSYDFWTLKRNGAFFYTGTLFEDKRTKGELFFDTRTNRIAESFLRIAGLYDLLKVPGTERILFQIRHVGLKNRNLTVANKLRFSPEDRVSSENEITTKCATTIEDIKSNEGLKQLVFSAVCDLSEMFNFFQPNKKVTDKIVEDFLQGRIN
jgi:hypothetical protein